MRFTHFFFLLYIFIFFGCKDQKLELYKIEATQIQISNSLTADAEIEAFIKPFREHIQKDLDSTLAYAMDTYSKSDGHLNTAIGNFMADAIYDESNPVFKSRTGHDIDMVLLNYGGIRSIISKGNISTRTAFEIMPFENSIVIVALKGSQIDSMVTYLATRKTAHPISKMKLVIDKDFNVAEVTINGKKINANETYYVATNDYLYTNGDNMRFFRPNEGTTILNYKVRNALIDHFKKVDTINPVIDDRFIQIN